MAARRARQPAPDPDPHAIKPNDLGLARTLVDHMIAADKEAPASAVAENPTNPTHATAEASPERTTPAIPKDAIWKSVIGATGGFGCERETFYRETVRDERGYRLRMGASEPVLYGVAIDRVHGFLMGHRLEHGPADSTTLGIDTSEQGFGEPDTEDMLRDLVGDAVERAMGSARGRGTKEPVTEEEWAGMAQSVGLAGEKLLGLWPNRVKPRTVKGEVVEWLVEPEPEGTPAGPPIGWLDQPVGVMTEAQRKMYAPGVVGGRGISGQPDYVMTRDGTIIGWVDVKALSKAGSYPAKWLAGEAAAYDYMCTIENGGTLPEWHGYLEYRRVTKPYWALIVAPVHPGIITIAESYFRRWGIALDGNDPDALAFNPKSCAKCEYREPVLDLPIPFPGCPIGQSVIEVGVPEGIDIDG